MSDGVVKLFCNVYEVHCSIFVFHSSRMSSLSVETNRSEYDQELYHRLRMNVSDVSYIDSIVVCGFLVDLTCVLFSICPGNGFHGFAWPQFGLRRSRRFFSPIARTIIFITFFFSKLIYVQIFIRLLLFFFSVKTRDTTTITDRKRQNNKNNKVRDLAVTTVQPRVCRALQVNYCPPSLKKHSLPCYQHMHIYCYLQASKR